MTAPFDPRYLVPLNLLPPVQGAPTAYLCTECGAALADPVCLDCKHYRLYNGAPVECLDLSRPPERDGVPKRLDALGWACAVLRARGHRNAARALLGHDADILWWSDVVKAVATDIRLGAPPLDLTPGNGLYRPDAGRAVVAHALRNHKEPTP